MLENRNEAEYKKVELRKVGFTGGREKEMEEKFTFQIFKSRIFKDVDIAGILCIEFLCGVLSFTVTAILHFEVLQENYI